MNELIEDIHYYVNDDGYVVLTAQFLLERGYCCGNGCRHCPFSYENVPEPQKSLLLKDKESSSQ